MDMSQQDIAELERAFEVNEQDAHVVVSGLSETQGAWRAQPGSWSVAECLDHLAPPIASIWPRCSRPPNGRRPKDAAGAARLCQA